MSKSYSNLLKNNPWIFPALILILLITAWSTRWEYIGEKTFDNGVTYQYKTDSWTGQTWLEKLRSNEFIETPVLNGKTEKLDSEFKINQGNNQSKELLAEEYWQKRNLLTNIWYGAAAITIIWLLIVLRRRKPSS